MLFKIADLITEITEVGGLASRFREYLYEGSEPIDIEIDTSDVADNLFGIQMSRDSMISVESSRQFFRNLVRFGGVYLHSSSVEFEGKAYMFSAYSGTGKSTHTRIWQQVFGEAAKVFNDDKTPLRKLEGTWYAYGAPWCGKDNININMKVPVAGICFLKQAQENKIRRLTPSEAAMKMIPQTIKKFKESENLDLMLSHVDKIVRDIPMFELENRPEPAAARLSYETMRKAAEEMGL